jgi:DNA-binding transcriptional regulator YiaG
VKTATIKARSTTDILAEAKSIADTFKAMPRNQPKDPATVAHLLDLRQESGLPHQEFCFSIGIGHATVSMWGRGKTSDNKDWPALQAELAKRIGGTLADEINAANIGTGKSTPPAQAEASKVVDLHPEAATGQALRHAVPVTLWRATNGTLYDTPEEAERVSLKCSMWHAAKALWAKIVERGDQDVDDLLVGPLASDVLALADAIRATTQPSLPSP